MKNNYFPFVSQIKYEGPDSDNPLAFKYYDENKEVAGKTMKDHFRFAIAYWHSFCNYNSDPFGEGTRDFPWDKTNDPLENAKYKLEAAFEFFTKIGAPYYCFHDRDIAPGGDSVEASEKNLKTIVDMAGQYQKDTGVKLLWGTANLFTHKRYMNGGASNPDFKVLCHGAAQVKAALDATVQLGGENYVFWGGREGYMYLFNTDMKRELDHIGEFFRQARDYGRKIGFTGNFLIEPKPMEPSKHQYDFDASTVIAFLQEHDLTEDFKLNIEANHATLANHSFAHELQVSASHGLLGSVDANQGDSQNGWDTDNFPANLYDCIEAMLIVLPYGGIAPGGFNFDAKVRRNSTDLEDLFHAHIGGMDNFSRGLLVANDILTKSPYKKILKERYQSYDSGKGADFENGKLTLEELRDLAVSYGEPDKISGKQELIENIINQHI